MDKLSAAKDELDKRYRDQSFQCDRAIRLEDWPQARTELKILCEMVPDEQDPRHNDAAAKLMDVEGKKVLMMHIGGYPGRYDLNAFRLIEAHSPDIFVCGHSHILKVVNDKSRGMLVLNPGAAGKYGFHLVRTALRFRIDNGEIHDMEVGEWPK